MPRHIWSTLIAATLLAVLTAGSSGKAMSGGRVTLFAVPPIGSENTARQPLTEEPRGPNVLIWYCCNGKRFHTIAFDTNQTALVSLLWGHNYDSVALRFPNCRGGKITMTDDGTSSNPTEYGTGYSVNGSLFNNATTANCEVIADVYQNGVVVNSISFRAIISS
jgi:hypothetical protein